MSGWNYRIVKEINPVDWGDEFYITVREVYYDDDGKPNGVTDTEVSPSGCDITEFMDSWISYRIAFASSILTFDKNKNKFVGEEVIDNDVYNCSGCG
jgi:hypothetical protein